MRHRQFQECFAPPRVHQETGPLCGILQTGGVWGTDDRVPIEYSSRVPWRSICSLQIQFADYPKVRWGTGAVVGRRVIMTAGHCVYAPDLGWAKSVRVTPGQNRANGGPFGSWSTRLVRSVGPWVTGDSRQTPTRQWTSPYDYGAVLLEEPIGDRTGLLSFAAASDIALRNLVVYTAGYPVDKPEGTLWASAGAIERVEATRLYYSMDAAEGNSGGPVFDFDSKSNDRTIVGIHTAWTSGGNSAVRITPEVEKKFREWIREFS